MKISAIDIGSNSVRLAMFEGGKTLYKRLETTRLGEGLSSSCLMKPEAMARTAQAVKNFFVMAKDEGAQKVYAYATEAVRSSSNGAEFVQLVNDLCGLEIDVLSGETEARTGLLGALRGRDGGIIDVGGASTEITVQKDGNKIYAKSVDIGTVRLYDVAGRNFNKLKNVISDKLEDYGSLSAAGVKMFAIGGTATTLASVKHSLKKYNPEIVNGTEISAEEVFSMAEKFLTLSVEDVKSIAGMEPRRADVIGGGALVLAEIMKKFCIPCITVSESDNLEGYVLLKEGWL